MTTVTGSHPAPPFAFFKPDTAVLHNLGTVGSNHLSDIFMGSRWSFSVKNNLTSIQVTVANIYGRMMKLQLT